jgi:hypothetical protein
VAVIAVMKNGLATLPIVIRWNAAEESAGLLTGALLIFALALAAAPKFLSARRARPHFSAVTPIPKSP